jgi:endonuclease YncB( thermonuclease family)
VRSALATALLLWTLSSVGARADCRLEGGPTHTVARVADVETLDLDDGRQVRLAGILVPRAEDVGAVPGSWPAEENARAALTTLVLGKSVTLRFDAQREDRYGRRLAHVTVIEAPQTLQQTLLAAGHARVEAQRRQRTCVDDLLAAEAGARAQRLGLWREAAYRVRAARPARDLDGFAGTFQIVTGTIRDVRSLRASVVVLRFGPDRRRDMAVHIASTDRDTLGLVGGDPAGWRGQQVEVRGWLTRGRTGALEIDLSTAGHIRRATAADAAPPR